MARNEVSRLKITIDIDQATGKILKFNQTLGNTKREVQQTGQAMTQLQSQTNQAGQSAAANAGKQTTTTRRQRHWKLVW